MSPTSPAATTTPASPPDGRCEDTTGFAKVLADPESGLLLGAHIIGPEAATVIQPLIQAMSLGQTARQVAEGQYWIHPALPEIIENALLQLWA